MFFPEGQVSVGFLGFFIVCEILTVAPVDTQFGADWSVAAAVVGLPVLVVVVVVVGELVGLQTLLSVWAGALPPHPRS